MFREKKFVTQNLVSLHAGRWHENIRAIQEMTACAVAPVFKANAYGHGLVEMSKIAASADLPFIAVDSFAEALVVLEFTDHEVLVMSAVDPVNYANMRLGEIMLLVSRPDEITALGETGKHVRIHLEIDTGMKRQGTTLSSLEDALSLISKYDNIDVFGVMSHLADADNPQTHTFNDQQVARFDQAVEAIRSAGHEPQWIHLAQSAGISRPASKYANVVRPGLVTYGCIPLELSDNAHDTYEGIQPILEATSRVVALQDLAPGETVSYGRAYAARKKERIAVIPFGYYEGLARELSNDTVLHSTTGVQLPVRGRINMNHTMLDATGADLAIGDEVVVISANPQDANCLQALARDHDIFVYELMVHISPTIRRVITS